MTISRAGSGEIPAGPSYKPYASRFGMLFSMGLPARDRELVQIVDAALADTATRAGEWLVCRPGCTQCCYGAFAINQLDVVRLTEGMNVLWREDPGLAAKIEARANAWIAENGSEFPGDTVSGLLGESEEDSQRFEDFANEVACPALDPESGRCDVYEWRPMTCRVFGPPVWSDSPDGNGGGLGYCELCFHGASDEEIAACEMTVPHELEQMIVEQIPEKGETVVAFALLVRGAEQNS